MQMTMLMALLALGQPPAAPGKDVPPPVATPAQPGTITGGCEGGSCGGSGSTRSIEFRSVVSVEKKGISLEWEVPVTTTMPIEVMGKKGYFVSTKVEKVQQVIPPELVTAYRGGMKIGQARLQEVIQKGDLVVIKYGVFKPEELKLFGEKTVVLEVDLSSAAPKEK